MLTLFLTQIWSSYDNFIAIGTSGHWVSFLIAAEGLNQDLISSAVIMQKTLSLISYPLLCLWLLCVQVYQMVAGLLEIDASNFFVYAAY